MKSKNLLINAAAVAVLTIGLSCVSEAQVIYNQGVPIQRAQGSATVIGTPQVYRPQQRFPAVQAAPAPTYYNVEMNEEQKKKASLGAAFVDSRTGISVSSVFTNGPAQQAGLSSGDVLIKVNGKAISNVTAFESMVGGMNSGDMLTMVKMDDGKEKEVQVKLMTMGQIIEASTVPEAGPFDQAAAQGEQELAAMRQQIKNEMAELEDLKKRFAIEEKRVEELKVKAKDARMKAAEMKKVEEKNRKMRMEALKKQAEEAAK